MTSTVGLTGNWHYPTEVAFGEGALNQLEGIVSALGCQSPLLVIDSFLLAQSSMQAAIAEWESCFSAVTVFSEFTGNPTEQHVEAGVGVAKATGCDMVIGVGGGSALDVAKCIALMAGQTLSLWDFVDEGDNYRRANADAILPIVAVPTTSGTGSEVGRAAVVTNSVSKEKCLIFHPRLLPTQVVCDPALAVTLPPALTAYTGMDALAHNLEALCAPGFHPLADGVAMEGLRLIKAYLPRAYRQGDDMTARANMMAASLMGATAFQKGLGAVHSLSHPVGGFYNLHHGLLNAVFMPPVLRFNEAYIEEKMTHLARYLSLPSPSFGAVLTWVESLNSLLNVPSSLAALGVDVASMPLDKLAERALADPSTATNPRALTLMDCRMLLQEVSIEE